MKYSIAFTALALGGLSLAQTVILDDGGDTLALLSNINPSDVAAILDPEVLGPPIGVGNAATIDFDAAEATSSVLALVATATDAQTDIITSTADSSAATQTVFAKRNPVGGSTGNVQRRDLNYPVDTSSYVSVQVQVSENHELTLLQGYPFGLYTSIYQLPEINSGSWVFDLPDPAKI